MRLQGGGEMRLARSIEHFNTDLLKITTRMLSITSKGD